MIHPRFCACVARALTTSALAACVVPPVPRRICFFYGKSLPGPVVSHCRD